MLLSCAVGLAVRARAGRLDVRRAASGQRGASFARINNARTVVMARINARTNHAYGNNQERYLRLHCQGHG